MLTLHCAVEIYQIAGRFVIARGAKTEARVVTVTLTDGRISGRGECVPYARYGETVESVVAQIVAATSAVTENPDRMALQALLPRGSARNAIDCALWDFEAKATGVPVAVRAGLPTPAPVVTAFTISLDAPDVMAAAATRAAACPVLKIKLGGGADVDRLRAVRAAAPRAVLIVDANEAWSAAEVGPMLAACREMGVALVEQPLPAGDDGLLATLPHDVPLCADESVHDREGLEALRDRYDMINVKLDKTGGLTEAIALTRDAHRIGFGVMVGCMVGTSLAMAPALLLATGAAFVDLDGPLLLARDRPGGLTFEGTTIFPSRSELWG